MSGVANIVHVLKSQESNDTFYVHYALYYQCLWCVI